MSASPIEEGQWELHRKRSPLVAGRGTAAIATDGWRCFADDVTFDDPVGAPTKHGRAAIETSWDRSHRDGRSWRLWPTRVVECGNELAVDLVDLGTVEGRSVQIDSIEIWRVGDDGRVIAVRSYFEPDATVNDPYYVPPS